MLVPESELKPRSWIVSRLLNLTVMLQISAAGIAWLGCRWLRQLCADVIERQSSTIFRHGAQHLLLQTKHAVLLVDSALAILPFLVVTTLLCIRMLKKDARQQVLDRIDMEVALRRERSLLEKRVESRTEELQSEVAERRRAEQLNRGRNHILEMLTQEKPAQDVFQSLTDVAAQSHSSCCCTLHLFRDGQLQMQAHSGLPAKLTSKLQQIAVDMVDAPEAVVLQQRKPLALEDLSRERKPWSQLLYAYGIQSLWSMPLITPDGTPLGTLTMYSLLRCQPSEQDWRFLESHSQMASMALERYRLQEELHRHAFHDSLTGLPNRLLGEKQLSAAIARGQRNQSGVAVLWIDLDKFKQTNDVYGHVAGDAVLKEISQRLSHRFRESDTVARMGGDEFMAVLENVSDRATTEHIAQELVAELSLPICFQGLMLNTAASIGVSLYPEDADSADLLQRNADLAMYEAKFGRHGFRVYSARLDSILSERRELEKAMIHALEHGGFALHYQPVYEASGRLACFEALLRFPHPVMGMIPPARLIPIAEESRMIISLGSWVLREACLQNRRWQQAGYSSVPIAVNISAMQFAREDFADEVAQVLTETGLNPDLLELELTESVMVQDFAESTRQLQRLKRLGVRVAVDDFGTGYSSLSNLHRLPIDRLKIDRSFIQALGEINGTLPIVEGIISMAHNMGIIVVAEGVETHEQMQTLHQKGCDCLQGYLFSKPVEADKAVLLLESGRNEQFPMQLFPLDAPSNAAFVAC